MIRRSYLLIGTILISLFLTSYLSAREPDWKHEAGGNVHSTSINQEGDVAAGSLDDYVYLFNKSGDLLWKYEANHLIYLISIN